MPEILNKENRTSFFLNFLAVVLGIVITFGGESLLSHKEEKRNLNSCLELVSSELQANLKCLDYGDSLMRNELVSAIFLVRYEEDYTKAPSDSLSKLANTPFTINEMSIYDDAFELLKNTGVLTKIKDKELALQVFRTYDDLQTTMLYYQLFYEHKKQYLAAAMNENVKKVLARDTVTAIDLWSEITATDEGKQFLREILRFLASYNVSSAYENVHNTIEGIADYVN